MGLDSIADDEFITIPTFAGDNLSNWISQMEEIMEFFEIPKIQYVNFAHFHVAGSPRNFVRRHLTTINGWSWSEFVGALELMFGENDQTDQCKDQDLKQGNETSLSIVKDLAISTPKGAPQLLDSATEVVSNSGHNVEIQGEQEKTYDFVEQLDENYEVFGMALAENGVVSSPFVQENSAHKLFDKMSERDVQGYMATEWQETHVLDVNREVLSLCSWSSVILSSAYRFFFPRNFYRFFHSPFHDKAMEQFVSHTNTKMIVSNIGSAQIVTAETTIHQHDSTGERNSLLMNSTPELVQLETANYLHFVSLYLLGHSNEILLQCILSIVQTGHIFEFMRDTSRAVSQWKLPFPWEPGLGVLKVGELWVVYPIGESQIGNVYVEAVSMDAAAVIKWAPDEDNVLFGETLDSLRSSMLKIGMRVSTLEDDFNLSDQVETLTDSLQLCLILEWDMLSYYVFYGIARLLQESSYLDFRCKVSFESGHRSSTYKSNFWLTYQINLPNPVSTAYGESQMPKVSMRVIRLILSISRLQNDATLCPSKYAHVAVLGEKDISNLSEWIADIKECSRTSSMGGRTVVMNGDYTAMPKSVGLSVLLDLHLDYDKHGYKGSKVKHKEKTEVSKWKRKRVVNYLRPVLDSAFIEESTKGRFLVTTAATLYVFIFIFDRVYSNALNTSVAMRDISAGLAYLQQLWSRHSYTISSEGKSSLEFLGLDHHKWVVNITDRKCKNIQKFSAAVITDACTLPMQCYLHIIELRNYTYVLCIGCFDDIIHIIQVLQLRLSLVLNSKLWSNESHVLCILCYDPGGLQVYISFDNVKHHLVENKLLTLWYQDCEHREHLELLPLALHGLQKLVAVAHIYLGKFSNELSSVRTGYFFWQKLGFLGSVIYVVKEGLMCCYTNTACPNKGLLYQAFCLLFQAICPVLSIFIWVATRWSPPTDYVSPYCYLWKQCLLLTQVFSPKVLEDSATDTLHQILLALRYLFDIIFGFDPGILKLLYFERRRSDSVTIHHTTRRITKGFKGTIVKAITLLATKILLLEYTVNLVTIYSWLVGQQMQDLYAVRLGNCKPNAHVTDLLPEKYYQGKLFLKSVLVGHPKLGRFSFSHAIL